MTRPPIRSLDEWAEIVHGDLIHAVDGIIAAGRHLREAKAEHKRGFKAWIESGALDVGYTQATRFMKIAEKLDGLESCTACNLPKDTLVLYGLVVHLDRTEIEAAIASGDIHPGLNRSVLESLVARKRNLTPNEALPELLELVQQEWSPRKNKYSAAPPKAKSMRALSAPLGRRRTSRTHDRLIAAGDVSETALESSDPHVAYAELLKYLDAVEKEAKRRASAAGISRRPTEGAE